MPFGFTSKHLAKRAVRNWSGSIAGYGFATTLFIVWLSDWKVIWEKVPYYNKKFEESSAS